MNPFRTLAARLRALLHRDAVAGEIHEELDFHYRSRVEQYEREGLAPDAARRKARRRVGNLALHQDRGYDVRGGGFMETVVQDVRHSVRLLTRQRGFTLVALLALALGIGASTAIFSVIEATVLRPLPYAHPEQLVNVLVAMPGGGTDPEDVMSPSIEDVRTWKDAGGVFTHLAMSRHVFPKRVIENSAPERIDIHEIDESYLALLGVTPIRGRAFTAADMQPNTPAVALLSHAYWQARYSSDPAVVGRTVRIDGVPTSIVGVLPPGFGSDTPVWRPMRPAPGWESQNTTQWHARRGTGADVIGRLRAGLDRDAAARDISAAARNLDPQVRRVEVRSILRSMRLDSREILAVLAGAVGLVVLIACVNVAGLLVARGATRRAELATRASLGAGRARLVRQLLTESLVLAGAGGVIGVALARLTLTTIVTNIPMELPADSPPAMSLTVLAAATALTILAGLGVGLWPALSLSGVRMSEALARGRHGGSFSPRSGQFLIVAEVTLAVVLLAGAGLMLRSFSRLLAVDLGFDPRSIVTLEAAPLDSDTQVPYYRALLERIRSLQGIESAGAIEFAPLSDGMMVGGVQPDGGAPVMANMVRVLPGYFEAAGIPLRQGRLFAEADLERANRAVLISEEAARTMFPNGPALGRRLRVDEKTAAEVVGVVGDVHQWGPRSPIEAQVYTLYKPAGVDDRAEGLTVVMRTSTPASTLAPLLRDVARAVAPLSIVERVRSGEEWLGDSVLRSRRRTVLLSLLGGLGLVLTLVGVLGVTGYAVARRTQEIGVRMAFGASPRQVVGVVVRASVVPVVTGVVLGIGGAVFATKIIESFLYETTATDPVTFALVALTIGAAATVAAWIPARRAARVDPVAALRAE